METSGSSSEHSVVCRQLLNTEQRFMLYNVYNFLLKWISVSGLHVL